MHRLTEHALLLLGAAVGTLVCLELLGLERTTVRARSAIAAPVTAAEAPPAKRMHSARAAEAAEGELRPTAATAPEPAAPRLVQPPREAKRPPAKKPPAAHAEAPAPKRAEPPAKPQGVVQSLLESVSSVLGTP
ncbi:MAG: hypothetical protein NW223_07620 [Hyphomicrobiaceae bacterium]|nr:hypothetical protein [Hyphomicrobiaceae bacterium]